MLCRPMRFGISRVRKRNVLARMGHAEQIAKCFNCHCVRAFVIRKIASAVMVRKNMYCQRTVQPHSKERDHMQ